jgi:hypothetical protein
MENKPLTLFVLYIIVTMAISFFGPMVYLNFNKTIVVIYMIFFLLIFTIGYKFSMYVKVRQNQPSYANIDNIIKFCIIFSVFSVGIEFYALVIHGKISFNMGSISANYFDAYSNYTRNSGGGYSFSQILFFISGVPKLVAGVLGTYKFKCLSKNYKLLLLAYFLLTFVTYGLGHGKQKQIGELVAFIVIALLIKMIDLPKFKQKAIKIRVLILSVSFLVVLSIIQFIRYEALGITLENFNSKTYYQSGYNLDHWIFDVFGTRFGFGLASLLSGYFSMGYYGLSLSLQIPFEWTYGIGNSYSLMVFFHRFLGTDFLLEKTYVMRMEAETGWPGLSRWHTVFPWLASDFTFIGALLIFFPIVFIFARCWKEILISRNPISILMFAWLVEGLLFVPANNQLFHGIDTLITTFSLILLWLLRFKLSILNKKIVF